MKQPVSDVVTRWFSSYEMMDWFREQKTAEQMYDIKHGADAAKNANGDAYKANGSSTSTGTSSSIGGGAVAERAGDQAP